MRNLRLIALQAMLSSHSGALENVHQRGISLPVAKLHWSDATSRITLSPGTEADAARITAAQAKRDRKNAKRLRDAMRGGK